MLYRRGFYTQMFASDGATRVIEPQLDFSEMPVTDTEKVIRVPMGRSFIHAKIWRQHVGRVPLYLLDADIPQNKPADRILTHQLYSGDREHRIRQEVLVGIGGLLALDALGIKANVIHMNEGHAAFAALDAWPASSAAAWIEKPRSAQCPPLTFSPPTLPSPPEMIASIPNSR